MVIGKYRVHRDYENINPKFSLGPIMRPLIRIVRGMRYRFHANHPGIEHKKVQIQAYRNGKIRLEIFSPRDSAVNSPCLLFIHGGAFVINASDHHKKIMNDYALQVPCKVVFVDYRLAPSYPFPHGIEDCYMALEWIINNSQKLGIDEDKIAVCGDSSGGAIAASLAQMARDRRLGKILFQLLVYPVTDVRMHTKSMQDFIDTPAWNARLTKQMWSLYLPTAAASIVPPYASPLAAVSLANLPPSYIEVAEFDCLRDEGIAYHDRLLESGGRSRLQKTSGTIHGFEVNYDSEYTQGIIRQRIEFMQLMFKS